MFFSHYRSPYIRSIFDFCGLLFTRNGIPLRNILKCVNPLIQNVIYYVTFFQWSTIVLSYCIQILSRRRETNLLLYNMYPCSKMPTYSICIRNRCQNWLVLDSFIVLIPVIKVLFPEFLWRVHRKFKIIFIFCWFDGKLIKNRKSWNRVAGTCLFGQNCRLINYRIR